MFKAYRIYFCTSFRPFRRFFLLEEKNNESDFDKQWATERSRIFRFKGTVQRILTGVNTMLK